MNVSSSRGEIRTAAPAAGTAWMPWYTRLPGRDDGVPPRWPRDAAVARDAARFGAATSGFVLLYGPDGNLLFQGGITPARGYEGESIGEDTLRKRAAGRAPALLPSRAPVYGCALLGAAAPIPAGREAP